MLKSGKLDSRLLEEIVFKNIKFKRPEVITRPGIGEDCAVVDFGSYECVYRLIHNSGSRGYRQTCCAYLLQRYCFQWNRAIGDTTDINAS